MGLIEKIFALAGFKPIRRVVVDSEVMDEALEIARRSHPHEFAALLEGRQEGEVLHVTGLIFLPSETSDEGLLWMCSCSHPSPALLGLFTPTQDL